MSPPRAVVGLEAHAQLRTAPPDTPLVEGAGEAPRGFDEAARR